MNSLERERAAVWTVLALFALAFWGTVGAVTYWALF